MRKFKSFLNYFVLTVVSILSVFPLYWMAVSATNKSVDIIGGKLIPGNYLLENWKSLLQAQDVGNALMNSFRNSILLTLVSLIICSIAGYGFEVYHDKAKDTVMSILLLAMMVPFVATLIPLFQMFSKMGLLNSTIGFILPTISTPFLIMLFRQSARSFPHDIIEAARIDGLGELKIFLQMFIPTMRSTYAAAMTIVFMNAWNNYLWPKVIMLSNEKITMPMMVANLLSGYVIDYGMVMLGVLVCTIPTVIVFFLLQKSFAEGITGAVK
ncbi:carbohydrate ABC transporter permease [Anaerocolumna sp. MB42-C2]|uniref:carbohydrate ABC transporter permease n=1 Tax=Anaerocolumna sp. MB42-C2 TaxID=3070997 RepID=UPI0027E060F4|nr:carbohydrate ABC transporter permease [Anaerocolumna sp. MB42-C2]WMJ89409.1 carbohydrate ABC transporter permease [Anaerocolumna sp. MB42-C2]